MTYPIDKSIMASMNWQKLIKDLQDLGWSQAKIGAEVGYSQVGVRGVLLGKTKQPSYDRAAKLLALHKREMKKGRG